MRRCRESVNACGRPVDGPASYPEYEELLDVPRLSAERRTELGRVALNASRSHEDRQTRMFRVGAARRRQWLDVPTRDWRVLRAAARTVAAPPSIERHPAPEDQP